MIRFIFLAMMVAVIGCNGGEEHDVDTDVYCADRGWGDDWCPGCVVPDLELSGWMDQNFDDSVSKEDKTLDNFSIGDIACEYSSALILISDSW